MTSHAPLRVAIDATPLLGRRSGVGEFCAGAIGALSRKGSIELSAFAVSFSGRRRLASLLPEGVRPLGNPVPAVLAHRSWRFSALPPVEWLAGAEGVDVVHGTNFVVPPARRAARVVTVHDLTPFRFPELCTPQTIAFVPLVRRAVAEGVFVHTHTEFVAAQVVEMLGADRSRVRAVASGIPGVPDPVGVADPSRDVDPETRQAPQVPPTPHAQRTPQAPQAPQTERLPPYVLALGTAEPRKDLPTLVRAFGHLARGAPELRLVIAGGDGRGSADLAVAIAASPARDRIGQLGYVDDATRARVLAGATVFAFPSIYEGLGYPPLEAMAAGVPVVAVAAGSIPEVVGDAAVLVPPGDDVALAESLGRLLDDGRERLALVERGRARAAEFSWSACGDGLANLYVDALRETGLP
jgi:glycosyltransferase involved in cell wall biosynthesis